MIGGFFFAVLLLLVVLVILAPKNPVALIQVVDAVGKPVAGAVIRPDGLRTKAGPYASGHYGWMTGSNGVPNDPVTTDPRGCAHVPYPKYVFERIETGEISFSVNHPEFVSDRPFRVVTTTPPAGAPWRVWLAYWGDRLLRRALVSQTAPVVLQKGAVLKIFVKGGPPSSDGRLFAQASRVWSADTNFWLRPEPGVVATRRLPPGTQAVRALQFDAAGRAWFSDVAQVVAITGVSNEVVLELKPGVTLRGRLDPTVPRPVSNGRVVAHVRPQGHRAQDSPPEWHAWRTIREDGSFEIESLPAGDLEIVALCHGFVSTNGPGQFKMRYPQKHVVGTNDLAITIGMEPTARLEVRVTDEKGQPVKDARVVTWPNVRYGEWSATVLLSDCYNTADFYLSNAVVKRASGWFQSVADFEGTTDGSGLAVVPNLPATVTEFSVEHSRLVLPAVVTGGGDRRRYATMTLFPGQTNEVSVRLEPRERSPISHY
jgi:hypothetical protein